MEDLARVHQAPHERALLGGALHGPEEREELLAIAGVLSDRLAERRVLHASVPGEARRVRREEREGSRLVALVLREVEADPPDHVPDRALALQVRLDRAREAPEVGSHLRIERGPRPRERIGRQVLGAGHRRRGRCEPCEIAFGRSELERAPHGLEIGHPAEPRQKELADVTPERERGRQLRRELHRPEVQEAAARPLRERRRDARCRRHRDRRARLRERIELKRALRRHRQGLGHGPRDLVALEPRSGHCSTRRTIARPSSATNRRDEPRIRR